MTKVERIKNLLEKARANNVALMLHYRDAKGEETTRPIFPISPLFTNSRGNDAFLAISIPDLGQEWPVRQFLAQRVLSIKEDERVDETVLQFAAKVRYTG